MKSIKFKRRNEIWTLDINGKPVKGEQEYEAPDPKQLYGYGSPISVEFARKIIRDFRDYANEKKIEVPFAFTFGKDSLLAILSQPECEGIRFYLAKKEFDSKIEGMRNGITMVAIGVKPEIPPEAPIGDDPEIGAGNGRKYLGQDLYNTAMRTMMLVESVTGLIYETIPPLPNPPGSR